MSHDKQRGLYEKFRVLRTDGRSATGERHENCEYFVLDLTHDRHALPAIQAYADSCRGEYPQLAVDVLRRARMLAEERAPEVGDDKGRPYRCGAFISATGEVCTLESDHEGKHTFVSDG